jgi:hypothetical protein
VYRVAQIVEAVKDVYNGKQLAPYEFPAAAPGKPRGNGPTTRKHVVLEIGKMRKVFKMEVVSNGAVPQAEFDFFVKKEVAAARAAGCTAGSELPHRSSLDELESKLIAAEDYRYTAVEVKKILEERRVRGAAAPNLTFEKDRLRFERDKALEAGADVDKVGDAKSSLGDAKSSLGDAKSSLGDAKISLGDAKSSLGDAKNSLGDAKSSLGDAKSSAGDAKRLLGDGKSSLGDAKSSRWVTLRARWVTLRALWVTLRDRWVTRRARRVTLRARWVTLRAHWVTLRARRVTRTGERAGGGDPGAGEQAGGGARGPARTEQNQQAQHEQQLQHH